MFISYSVRGKDDVFHAPEPLLSWGSVNHAGVVVTSGKLWEGGFRSEPGGTCPPSSAQPLVVGVSLQ